MRHIVLLFLLFEGLPARADLAVLPGPAEKALTGIIAGAVGSAGLEAVNPPPAAAGPPVGAPRPPALSAPSVPPPSGPASPPSPKPGDPLAKADKGNPAKHPEPPIQTAPEAPIAVGSAKNLGTAVQQAAARPMDPVARQQLNQAGTNAAVANALLNKAAASGRYNLDDYGKLKAALAQMVGQAPVAARPAQDSKGGASRRSSRGAAPAVPSSGSEATAVSVPVPSGEAVQVVAGTGAVSVRGPVLRTPSDGAATALQRVEADVAAIHFSDFGGASSDEGPRSFTSTFLSVLRQSGERAGEVSLQNAPAPDGNEREASSEVGKATAGSGAVGGVPSTNEELSPKLSLEEREVLAGLVKRALDAAVERGTTEEGAVRESELSEEDARFVGALKLARTDEKVFEALSGDIALAIESRVARDKSARSLVSRLADREKRRWEAARQPSAEPERRVEATFALGEYSAFLDRHRWTIVGALALLLLFVLAQLLDRQNARKTAGGRIGLT